MRSRRRDYCKGFGPGIRLSAQSAPKARNIAQSLRALCWPGCSASVPFPLLVEVLRWVNVYHCFNDKIKSQYRPYRIWNCLTMQFLHHPSTHSGVDWKRLCSGYLSLVRKFSGHCTSCDYVGHYKMFLTGRLTDWLMMMNITYRPAERIEHRFLWTFLHWPNRSDIPTTVYTFWKLTKCAQQICRNCVVQTMFN